MSSVISGFWIKPIWKICVNKSVCYKICPFSALSQHVEVHGVCTCKDWRPQGERSKPETSGNPRLHLLSAFMWGTTAKIPDSAQVANRVRTFTSFENI